MRKSKEGKKAKEIRFSREKRAEEVKQIILTIRRNPTEMRKVRELIDC